MRRRRSGRGHLSDIFYNTGDMNERTVDESFGFSRDFMNTINEPMMEEDRIEQEKRRHRLEQEQHRLHSEEPANDPLNRPSDMPSEEK